MHARAVSVEDARDLDLDTMLAVIVEEQRFGTALALVITGARTDGIGVTPVILGLRMYFRVAVDLAGGGLQDARLDALGQAQHVDRAVYAGLGGLHRVELVVDGRSRAGQIEDFVGLDVKRESDVVAHQLEHRLGEQMGDVVLGAGVEIVDA